MKPELVMLVTSVPRESADIVRQALAQAGAGTQGNYSHCSFTYEGVGRFLPGPDANPAAGNKGEINAVPEVRIEVLCERSKIDSIVAALKAAHPYEEPAYHYFSVEM
jgi:hypothetical protein